MILYEGKSTINGEPVVAIGLPLSNPKIGRMFCTYIVRTDRKPSVAALDGSDVAICGTCPFRAQFELRKVPESPKNRVVAVEGTRTCYVRLDETADEEMSPDEIWDTYKMGGFGEYQPPEWNGKLRRFNRVEYHGGLPVRVGSYGEPCAIPFEIWADLLRPVNHWTGYVHAFKTCDQRFKRICMASVDSPEQRDEAQAMGWRTFLVRPDDQIDTPWSTVFSSVEKMEDSVLKYDRPDILCPATDPHPKRNATCSTCLLCRGTTAKAPSIFEIIHGANKGNHTW